MQTASALAWAEEGESPSTAPETSSTAEGPVAPAAEDIVSTAGADDPATRRAHVSFDVPSVSFALFERTQVEQVQTFDGTTSRVISDKFERLCYSPCEISLPAGTHTLAIATKEGDPVVAPAVTLTPGSHRLTAEYTDNSSTRHLGMGVAMVGAVIGSLISYTGYEKAGADGPDTGLTLLGLAISSASLIGGVAMGLTADTAVIKVDPDGQSDGERWSMVERRATARAATGFGPF